MVDQGSAERMKAAATRPWQIGTSNGHGHRIRKQYKNIYIYIYKAWKRKGLV